MPTAAGYARTMPVGTLPGAAGDILSCLEGVTAHAETVATAGCSLCTHACFHADQMGVDSP